MNDIDLVMMSGTLSESTGDHLPVFEISNIYFENDSKSNKFTKFYDYSNANVNKFIEKLEIDLSSHTASDSRRKLYSGICKMISTSITPPVNANTASKKDAQLKPLSTK